MANPSILSTYTAERRSVADSYSKQSVKNGKEIFALLQSLKTAGVEDVAQARRNMMDALADPAQHAKIVAGIEGQREHFDNVSDIVLVSPSDCESLFLTFWLLVGASYRICVWSEQATTSCIILYSKVCPGSTLASCLDQIYRSAVTDKEGG